MIVLTKEPETLLGAVNRSLRAATWLTSKDAGAMELARKYAALVDDSLDSGDPAAINRAHAVSGPNLQKTLMSLGLTPESRGELGVREEKALVDPVDKIKARRRKKAAGQD